MTRTLNPRPAVVSGGAARGAGPRRPCSGGDEPAPDPSPSRSAPSVDASDAPIQVAEDGLPTDFPRDEVPIIAGDIVSVTVPRGEKNPAFDVLVLARRGDHPGPGGGRRRQRADLDGVAAGSAGHRRAPAAGAPHQGRGREGHHHQQRPAGTGRRGLLGAGDELTRLLVGVLAIVTTTLAAWQVVSQVDTAGPVLFAIGGGHGVHVGDLPVLGLMGALGIIACGGLWARGDCT